jgi:hypothetical protein
MFVFPRNICLVLFDLGLTNVFWNFSMHSWDESLFANHLCCNNSGIFIIIVGLNQRTQKVVSFQSRSPPCQYHMRRKVCICLYPTRISKQNHGHVFILVMWMLRIGRQNCESMFKSLDQFFHHPIALIPRDALPSHGVKPTLGFHKVKLWKVELGSTLPASNSRKE